MPQVFKVIGCPGAGKTTYLLDRVEEELSNGISSERIGYFSFTRKAAEEAKARAIKRFPHLHAGKDFPFFRTLHSLAFHVLGIKKPDVMQMSHYEDFSKMTGIEVGKITDEGEWVKTENPVLNAINLARLWNRDLRQYYNESELDIEWHHFEYVERAFRPFKQQHGLLDFTDMLIQAALQPELLPKLDVVIVDEAQDLSHLQWQLVHALIKTSDRAYVASDTDQALYMWAGADIDSLFALDGQNVYLEQSWRVPAKIHRIADYVVKRIQRRFDKKWYPRDYEGEVHTYTSFEHVPVHEGEWLCLAATNYMLDPIAMNLKSRGLLFERGGYPSVSEPILNAVYGWERLRKGHGVPGHIVAHVYQYMSSENIDKGMRTFKGDKESLFKLEDLENNFGLHTREPWFEALGKISHDKVEYIRAMIRRGTKFSRKPNITLSTIHGAKGGEADHVMLMLDISARFAKEYALRGDAIERMLYVALTRSKKTLHLVLPKNQDLSFKI